MAINPFIFREYDIRGLVDKDLNDETVRLIGRGYSAYLAGKGVKTLSVGGDVRLSSGRYMDILAQAAVDSGLNVIKLGYVPTPLSYYSLYKLDVGGSIMVTGSHNPADFNGFKLGLDHTTIYGQEIKKVLEIIQAEKFVNGKGTVTEHNIIPEYEAMVLEKFKFKRKVKVVVDAGNGTAALFVPALLRKAGVEVVELFCEVDGRFPNHHPDPTVEKNLKDLKAKVAETGADAGIAFDGDSDRIGVVDNNGKVIWGDYLLLLYTLDMLKSKPGASVIYEVKCSQALEEEITKAGGVPVMWKTGHSLLKAKMKETGALLAGEMSGHMFFADRYFGYDDAVYAAFRLIEIMANTTEKLSSMVEKLPSYVSTPEMRLECASDADKFNITEKAVKYFQGVNKTITIDGVRILFGDGWGLIRSSNTQPILVLRFEAKNEKRLNEIKTQVIAKLKEFGTFTEE
ncbi:MAG: phosphomannomutase/phosphoglucomutase [Fibrobacteres bacterium]|nr:phosphomannomutase/phosphoglucomutase [Fibrobacterota bacterium]